MKVFCDETVAALESHPRIDHRSVIGTTIFIKLLVKFWKILNVRGLNADIRFKDPDRAVIRSKLDPRLGYVYTIFAI